MLRVSELISGRGEFQRRLARFSVDQEQRRLRRQIIYDALPPGELHSPRWRSLLYDVRGRTFDASNHCESAKSSSVCLDTIIKMFSRLPCPPIYGRLRFGNFANRRTERRVAHPREPWIMLVLSGKPEIPIPRVSVLGYQMEAARFGWLGVAVRWKERCWSDRSGSVVEFNNPAAGKW